MTKHRTAAAGAALALAFSIAAAAAQETAPQETPPQLPETFRGLTARMGGSGPSSTHRLRITIDRWTTPEERKAFLEALQKGGQKALLEAMDPIEVGWATVDEGLRYRLRTAATFTNDRGRVVRVSTDRPIQIGEVMGGFRSLDYPFGVVEFTLPPDGKPGEGTMVFAASLGFDDKGNLVVSTLPGTTSAQHVMGMEKERPKKKKVKSPPKE